MSRPLNAVVLTLLCLVPAGGASASPDRAETQPSAATPSDDPVQRWKGLIEMGPLKVEFVATFKPEPAGGVSGTIDIPMQGVVAAPLQQITLSEREVRFTFKPMGAPFEALFVADRHDDGDRAAGTITQAGQSFPLSLQRVSETEAQAVGPPRPQHPKPPFPYAQREVTYTNAVDGTTLAGTLTLPEGAGPHPAVILISGSGPQDRDETLMGHKPFLVIADHLTRRGLAVLRSDDRGVGESSGSVLQSSSEDFAGDVLAAIEFLNKQPQIDAHRVGLIGHSEGGIVAPMVAARCEQVAFIVLLAGTGLPGADILRMQLEAILKASGTPPEIIRRQLDAQGRIIDLVLAGADEEAVRQATRELVALQSGRPATQTAPASEGMEALVSQQAANMMSPWFRSFLALDPREALRRVRCPVLAMNGSLDLQVPADRNLSEIERAVGEAGNAEVTVVKLEGLNHLFQEVTTGLPNEYAMTEQTISPRALEALTDWLLPRAGLKR